MGFKQGDKVLVDERVGIITGNVKNNYWEVDFLIEQRFFPRDSIRLLGGEPQFAEAFGQGKFAGISDFRMCLYPYRLSSSLSNFMYSMGNMATKFLPHQFVPVIKFLESYTNNLLIADEVGLGKTIEAMYIWEEVRARERGKRLLIVCPARLRVKWQSDVKRYFNLKAEIVSSAILQKKIEEAIHDHLRESFVSIISLEGLRTSNEIKELLNDDLKDKVFDLVIIDEAHYLRNSETKSYKTGVKLRDATNHLLLLSATPIQTGSDNFFNLLSLLSPYEFYDRNVFDTWLRENIPLVQLANALDSNMPKEGVLILLKKVLNEKAYAKDPLFQQIAQNLDEICTNIGMRLQVLGQIKKRYFYNALISRNRKCDVFENRPQRVSTTVRFTLSDYEREFYELVSDYLRSQVFDCESFSTFRLIARQRQMASSIPAALLSWRECVVEDDVKRKEKEDKDEFDSIFDLGEEEPRRKSAIINAMPHFQEFDLKKLINEDSKFNAIYTHIKDILKENPKEKIVLFSFFRKTIEYLTKRFSEKGISCISIMGGVSPDETDGVIKNFKDGSTNLLLTTEVCSEGVDLQFACYEINYDLPWNPMRLEQRIGRIDRIGQESSKIFICNAICDNTIEDRVLEKLYERIAVVINTLGNIEEVLGEEIPMMQLKLFKYKSMTQAQIDDFIFQNVKAIKNKEKMQVSLEQQAGIIASDYQKFILDNVKKSYDNRRHVAPEEIIYAIEDLFEKKYHGSSIEFTPSHLEEVKISLSSNACYAFNQYQKVHCPETGSALLTTTSAIPCSIRQRQSNKNCEVIDVNHPLLRWVLHEMNNEKNELTRCEFLEVNSQSVPRFPKIKAGTYVYYIRKWESRGVQTKNELWYYMMDIETQEVLSQDVAEQSLVLTMLYGESADLGLLVEDVYKASAEALEALYANLMERCSQKEKEHKEENEALGKVQGYYIERSFEQKKKKIEEIIKEHELKGNKGKGLAEAERRRLLKEEMIHNERLAELNKKFDARSSFEEITLGILIVK